MVATSQPLAAEAGLSILRDGGNAFDAADGEVGALRSCGPAPADATIETVQAALEETDDETLAGATEPRKDGVAIGY
ncbi:hypothetical protein JMJ58_18210 [Haloterrigena salifodinae]|uniref:Uncharacterized protein n=1 Tax=Haloterrigena salifodinae TaxID=2675099 RepID=A0A8T8DZ98_9EURY|nr:hypothetical protein JMJ58_18210 [Haloterrigena salifodinae]